MKLFDQDDYREIIRTRVRDLSRQRRSFTLKKVAQAVPMQYTYLSRALNRDDTHLSEDQLYSVCQQLDFFTDELEYVFALRAHAVARHAGRRAHILKTIEKIRRSQDIQAPQEETRSGVGAREAQFLLSPLAWLVYFSLAIAEYRSNPRKLCSLYGLSELKLQEILRNLAEQTLIETDASPWKVTRVLKNHFHYSPTHPLIRIHQHLLKDFAGHHLQKILEDEKTSFMATFNADPKALELIQRKFREFIREVEKIAVQAPSKKTYQLVFDLFAWN